MHAIDIMVLLKVVFSSSHPTWPRIFFFSFFRHHQEECTGAHFSTEWLSRNKQRYIHIYEFIYICSPNWTRWQFNKTFKTVWSMLSMHLSTSNQNEERYSYCHICDTDFLSNIRSGRLSGRHIIEGKYYEHYFSDLSIWLPYIYYTFRGETPMFGHGTCTSRTHMPINRIS